MLIMVVRACHDPATSGEGFGEKHCAESTATISVRKDQKRIGAAFGTGRCVDSNVAACWSPVVVRLWLRRGRIPHGHGERLLLPVLLVLEIEDLIADIEEGLGQLFFCVRAHGRATQAAQNKETAEKTSHIHC